MGSIFSAAKGFARAALATVCCIAAAACTASGVPAARGPSSVRDGVFTIAQARRGAAVFERHCAECHFADEYADGYLDRWAGQSVYELYDRLRSTMPELTPGALPPEQYAELLALFFEQNALPSGSVELPAEASALQAIVIE